jgi:hypothetical protein
MAGNEGVLGLAYQSDKRITNKHQGKINEVPGERLEQV